MRTGTPLMTLSSRGCRPACRGCVVERWGALFVGMCWVDCSHTTGAASGAALYSSRSEKKRVGGMGASLHVRFVYACNNNGDSAMQSEIIGFD